MVETEFVLRRLEAVLDGPAMPLYANEGFHGRVCRAPRREEGQIAIGDMAPDQQTPGPRAGQAIDIFVSIKVCEFEIDPVVKPGPLGAVARRQAMPCSRIEVARDLRGGARDHRPVTPRAEAMVALHAQHISLAGTTQRLLDVADTVDRIRRDPGERLFAAIARSIISTASAGLVAKAVPLGTCAAASRAGSVTQLFGRYSARSTKAWPLAETYAANTPIWQLVTLPADPVYWRPTPHDALPCFPRSQSRR